MTGFYPQAVQVEWLGAQGLPLVDRVSSGEVLPNGDSTEEEPECPTGIPGHPEIQLLHSGVARNITVTQDKGT